MAQTIMNYIRRNAIMTDNYELRIMNYELPIALAIIHLINHLFIIFIDDGATYLQRIGQLAILH